MIKLNFLDFNELEEEVLLLTRQGLFSLKKPRNDIINNYYWLHGKKYPIEESLSINNLEQRIIQENQLNIDKFSSKDQGLADYKEVLKLFKNNFRERFMESIVVNYKISKDGEEKTLIENKIPNILPEFKHLDSNQILEGVINKIINSISTEVYFIAGNICFGLQEGYNKEEYIRFKGKDYVAYHICTIKEFKEKLDKQFFSLMKEGFKGQRNQKKEYKNLENLMKRYKEQDIYELTTNKGDKIGFKKQSEDSYQIFLTLAPFAINYKYQGLYYIFKNCKLGSTINFNLGMAKMKEPTLLTEERYKHPAVYSNNIICWGSRKNKRWKKIGIDFNKFYEIENNSRLQIIDNEGCIIPKTVYQLFADVLEQTKLLLQRGYKPSADIGVNHLEDNSYYRGLCFKTEAEVLRQGVDKNGIYICY